MTDKIQTLYYIKDLRDDNIIYVGKTKDFIRRKQQHFGNKRKQPIDLYMFEQGKDNFEMLPFTDEDYSIKTDEELYKDEGKKILELQPLMNIRKSGLISKDIKEYIKEYSNQYYKKSEKRKQYFNEYHKSERYKKYRREYYKQKKAKLIENI